MQGAARGDGGGCRATDGVSSSMNTSRYTSSVCASVPSISRRNTVFQERADTSGRPDAALQYSICDRRGAALVGVGSCGTQISF